MRSDLRTSTLPTSGRMSSGTLTRTPKIPQRRSRCREFSRLNAEAPSIGPTIARAGSAEILSLGNKGADRSLSPATNKLCLLTTVF